MAVINKIRNIFANSYTGTATLNRGTEIEIINIAIPSGHNFFLTGWEFDPVGDAIFYIKADTDILFRQRTVITTKRAWKDLTYPLKVTCNNLIVVGIGMDRDVEVFCNLLGYIK